MLYGTQWDIGDKKPLTVFGYGLRKNSAPFAPVEAREAMRTGISSLTQQDDAFGLDDEIDADSLAWDAIPLRRATAIKPPRRRSLLRKARRGSGGASAIVLLAALALTAACGSVVRPVPGDPSFQAKAVPSSDPVASSPRRQAAAPEAAPIALRDEPVVMARPEDTQTAPAAPLAYRPEPSIAPRAQPERGAATQLVAFDSAPFPYDGVVPGRGPFLNASGEARRGHRTARGQVLWQDETFGDNRVLMHVPPRFDPNRPAVMVVFFHGHGATIERDVWKRQQVPDQIAASGANAILVAPQFAIDARDSSAGHFWEPGGFTRFLSEAADRAAAMQSNPGLAERFKRMPVVIVAYSGGFLPAAWGVKDIAATNRVRGIVLLDALYGELDTFAGWAASSRSGFLVSAYTHFTQGRNAELERMLAQRGVQAATALPDNLARGGATFLATGPGITHTDYVTRAWVANPMADILRRLPEYDLNGPEVTASLGTLTTRRERTAAAEVP